MLIALFVTAAHAAAQAPAAVPPATANPPPIVKKEGDAPQDGSRRPPEGLLSPIAENGGLPRIYSKMYDMTAEELRFRAAARQYGKQIRIIRHKHFGEIKVEKIRQQGVELLREFTDPASFRPMIEVLDREKDDVRLAMLDHFCKQGDEGQAALGWVAIHDNDAAIRNEALKRMVSPVTQPVLYILNDALRSDKHDVVNAAATVAGALNVIDAIPLLIFAQAAAGGPASEQTGDLAWIAIQTQQAYIADLVPVAGDGAGAFEPVVGIISEGVVLRVVDAVVIEYRTEVHQALVNLTTHDWGQPTQAMAYNVQAWWDWFNDQYVPFKREQAKAAELAKPT